MDGIVAIATFCGLFLGLLIWGMYVIRKKSLEEKGLEAMGYLLKISTEYYLCGTSLERWLIKSIPTRLVWFGAADYSRQFGELMAYIISKTSENAVVYFREEIGSSNIHYAVFLRFTYGGETWQYDVLHQYGLPYVTRVHGINRDKDIEGCRRTEMIVAWLPRWHDKWEACRTAEGSMGIEPDAVYIQNHENGSFATVKSDASYEQKSQARKFDWSKYRDSIREKVAELARS